MYAADSFLCRKISGVGLLAGFPPNLWDAATVLGGMASAVANGRFRDVILAGMLGEGLRAVAPTHDSYRKLMGSAAAAENRSSDHTDAGAEAEVEVEHLRLERSASWVLPLQVMTDLSFKRGQLQRPELQLPCVVLGGADDDLLVVRIYHNPHRLLLSSKGLVLYIR